MKSRTHHNKGLQLDNTPSRNLETASTHCRSIMLFIFVQSLKREREPALLNAHQVPIAICSCMAIKKPRISKRKSSKICLPGRSHSHPKPVPCMPVLYNIIKSGFLLEVKSCFGRISMMRLKYVGSCSGTDLSLNPVLMAFVQRFNSQVHAYY